MSLEPPAEDSNVTYVPLLGTYITFSFDLEATFDLNLCDLDGEAVNAMKAFSSRTYVGYCCKYQELPYPTRKYHRITIRPLQQGLTVPMPEFNIESDMCTPVYPETYHPLSRVPIKPNKPFPWPGLYHPTCMDVRVRVPTGEVDYSDAYHSTRQERTNLTWYMHDDDMRRAAAERGGREEPECELASYHPSQDSWYAAAGNDQSCGHPAQEDGQYDECDEPTFSESEHPEGHAWDGIHNSSSDLSTETSEEDEKEDTVMNPEDIFLALATMEVDVKDDSQFTPVVRFTPDLSGIEELPDAHQLFMDIEELERMVKRCLEGPPVLIPQATTQEHVSPPKPDPSKTIVRSKGATLVSRLESGLRKVIGVFHLRSSSRSGKNRGNIQQQQ